MNALPACFSSKGAARLAPYYSRTSSLTSSAPKLTMSTATLFFFNFFAILTSLSCV